MLGGQVVTPKALGRADELDGRHREDDSSLALGRPRGCLRDTLELALSSTDGADQHLLAQRFKRQS